MSINDLQPAIAAVGMDIAAAPLSVFDSSRGFSLTEAQIASFFAEGFVVVDNLADAAEIAKIREIYDQLFSEHCGWNAGDFFDMAGPDDLEQGLSLPQMFWPSHYAPALARTALYRNASVAARQLLGPAARRVFEHAILKPAARGAETPWHQDDAFNQTGSGYSESISVWMPLQDVTPLNGCLYYVPGSHRGPLFPHRSPGNDPRIHGLETSPPADARAIAAPVPAGGAVIHHSRTLHRAGSNFSEQPRRACTLGFAIKSWRGGLRRDYDWNLAKQTGRQARQLEAAALPKRLLLRMLRLARRHGLYPLI